jgi:hypothetical protein
MTTVAKIKKDGSLHIKDDINERLPVVTNGLVAYYPLDSQAGGVDVVSGNITIQNLENEINILDCLKDSWRDPNSWSTWGGTNSPQGVWDETEQAMRFDSYSWYTIKTPIPIDTSKHWYIEATMKQGASAAGTMYFGTISYDVNMTELPGHPGTYDYFGNVGSSVPTTWQIYNNTAISGVARTSESTDVGNYAVWHTGTKFVRILIITNYSGQPGPTWVKNLKFYHKDTNTSNAIVTEDGIAIQEATTNLLPNQPTPTYGPWGGFVGTSTSFIAPNGHIGIILQVSTGGGCQWKGGLDWITVSPSTTYTISCKIKFSDLTKVSANFFYIRQYYSTGSAQIGESGVFNSSNITKLDNGYYLTWASFTTHSGCTSLVIHGYEYTGNQTISCYDTQLEQKLYPTAFINGTKSAGLLSIPNPVKTGEYTINFKCSIPTTIGTSTGYQTIMCMGNYYTTNSWTIMDQGGSVVNGYQVLIRKGAGDEWAWGGGFTSPSNFHNKNVYTLVRNSTNYLTYFNGEYTGSLAHLSTTMQDYIYIGSRDGGGSLLASVISELSIYNRSLSASEIKELAGEGFKITLSGSTTPLLVESPIIPLDGYYFPLASDTKDSSKTIDASENVNVVFDDGSAWVGTATTNLVSFDFNDGTTLYDTYNYDATGTKTLVFNPNFLSKNKLGSTVYYTGTSGYKYFAIIVNTPSTATYTFSYYAKTNFVTNMNNQQLWRDNGVDRSVTGDFNPIYTKYFKKYSTTGPVATGYLHYFPIHSSDLDGGVIVNYSGYQLEQKIFSSPFVNGSRGASSLEYNLYSSIGLDWSGNWTICYWKKPIATHEDNLTAFNIESLGCNGNSVGGGFVWWGKTINSNVIDAYPSSSAFTPSDYFNNWQFITIVKSSTTVTLKTQLVTGTVYVRTFTGPTVANQYLTQYGYDLKLGGWDNANPTNTYFRDLIVVKRALSDTELINIYKQFSIYKTKVNTQNLIEDGL